jgi:hypothetical protein
MGKDRENKFHPGKGKPSGANKSEPEIPSDLPGRHPNRNTSKGDDNSSKGSIQNKSTNATFTEEFTKTQPEELPGILTKDIFIELAAFNNAPCVSILMPTNKAGVQVNEQADITAFKTALQQAEKILKEKETDQITIKRMLTPGYDLLREDAFWLSLNNGLAVFIADGFFKYVKLPAPMIQHVRVNTSFYVSPLVPFMVRLEYFYILDMAKKFPRFYRADSFGIEHLLVEEMPSGVDDVVHFEEKEGDKLFRTGGRGGTGGANFHGIGGGKPDEKEHIAAYLQEVDNTIWQSHLNRENVPLLLAGQDFLIPIYKSVTKYKNIWPGTLTGNQHQKDDNELYEDAIKVMKPFFDQSLEFALEDYGNKLATPLTSSMIETIIPATYYSKVSHLFVKKGMQVFGSFNEMENKLILGEEGAINEPDDLVDKAVIKTIQNGGEVFFLDAEQMPNQSELAAIFRY